MVKTAASAAHSDSVGILKPAGQGLLGAFTPDHNVLSEVISQSKLPSEGNIYLSAGGTLVADYVPV